jgi:hypothetical protein
MKAISFVTIAVLLAIIFIIPIVLTVENTTIPSITTSTLETTISSTTTIVEETTTVNKKTEETTTLETTTIPETTSTTTLEITTTSTSTTSTLPPQFEDKKPPVWSNLRNEPSVVKQSDSANIIVDWYDNVGLDTVIIYENSTGVWEEHICDKETGHCSLGITHLSVSSDITSSFLIIGFFIPFNFVILALNKVGRLHKIILPFLGLVVSIFILSILLFPEVSRNISRTFSRLGIIPLGPIKTFSHTIPASNLNSGEVVGYYSFANDTSGNENMTEIRTFLVQPVEVVTTEPSVPEKIETVPVKEEHEKTEINKPVKWRKELVVKNPSTEEVKGYEVSLPKDANNIIVKDERGEILYTDMGSWKIDIPGKENISYFVEYETPAPYKEESVIEPFVLGKKYEKRIKVKSDFVEHYNNVKAYTDIPEELFKENYTIKLYHIIDNSKVDVTDNPSYEVNFVDSDNNGLNDRIEWIVPQLSEEQFDVEASITIINVQSYPTVYGNWTVRFNTTGIANLTITPINNTKFGRDLEFLELRCGSNTVNPMYDGKSVFYENWTCSEEGRIIDKVLKPGKHTLEFRFGDDVEYAYNMAVLEKAMIAYRSNTGVYGLNSPKYKMWNNETGWENEIELETAGNPITFVKVVASPVSPKRIIITQGQDGYLDAYVSNDGNSWAFSSNIGQISDATKRNFDVDFETATGDAIVVYSVVSTSPSCDLAYKVLPASTSSFSGISEQCIDDTVHSNDIQYTWIVTDRNPVSTSEELIVVGFDSSNSDNDAWVWNGNSWGNQLEISNDATASSGYKALSVKYATDGSKGMVVSASGTRGNVNWRYWNGASWSGSATFDLDPSDNGDARWLRLKADPSSDDIQLVAIDSRNDMHTSYWNGVSWILTSNIETNLDTSSTRCVDFAWNPSGSTGVLIWDWTGSSTLLRYRTCSPQCNSGTQTISTYAGTGYWIQAAGNPRDEDNTKILFGRLNSNFDIGSINRSSATFSNYGDSAITADTTVTAYESFEIAFLLVEPILSFNITLPGLSPIQSSGTKPGTLTTPINFSATHKTEYNVVPCVYNSNDCQDATTPIFNFTNTGNIAEKWSISLSQALPSYIHLYGNTSSNPSLQEITTIEWTAANNIPVNGYAEVWLWADFIDVPPGRVDIAINHTSTTAT